MPDSILDLDGLKKLATRRNITLGDALADKTVVAALAGARRNAVAEILRATVTGHEAAIQAAIDRIKPKEMARSNPQDIARTILETVAIPDDARAQATEALNSGGRLQGVLPADAAEAGLVAIADLPELRPELARAEVARLTGIAGLRNKAAEALVKVIPNTDALTDQRIGTLVIEKTLTRTEAERIGLVASMARILGEDSNAVERLSKAEFDSLGGPIAKLSDILRIDDDALAKIVVPQLADKDPAAAQARAQDVRITVEERFPTDGLAARLRPPGVETLRTAYEKSRSLIQKDPVALDITPPDADKETAANLAALRATANAYPGLGIREILTKGGTAQATVKGLAGRIKLFEDFAARNAGIDLRTIDFSPESKDIAALDFGGLQDGDRDAVLGVYKARARTLSVGGTVRTSAALMGAGLYSGIEIANMQIDDLASRAGIGLADAKIVIDTARDARLGVGTLIGSLADELRWRRPDWVWIGPLLEDVTDGLRKLPGYQDLFGNQSYCDCAHCDSILSPAAYFVDLMTFVDEKVTSKEFTGAKLSHALKLQNRRPDLWSVPLNCSSTHDLVPVLEIINEILEAAIATQADPAINGADRAAVTAKVYADLLPGAVRSFVTPFDRRVAAADLFLRDFDTDRYEIVTLSAPDGGAAARNSAALSLSIASYDMIRTPRPQWAYLRALYRHSFPSSGDTANPFDVQDLLAVMDVDAATLAAIINTPFVQGSDTIRIVAQKRSADSVQNDIERVTGMTRGALDRMHRFQRLALALDWHPRTLGVVLDRLGGGLDEANLSRIIGIARTASRLGLDIDVSLALSGAIPTETVGADPDTPGLMHRLFNDAAAGIGAAPFPAPTIRFVHPGLRDDAALPETAPNAGIFVSQRLRIAFGLTDAALLDLIRMLAPSLGIDPDAAAETDRGFLLTADALSLLYRHAILADALKLGFDDLPLAIRIATGTPAVTNASERDQLLSFVATCERLGIKIETAAALMGLVDDRVGAGVFSDADAIALAAMSTIATNESAVFAATVFALIDGVSEDQSREIVAANAALFQPAPRDMLRLVPTVGLSPTITAPTQGFPAGISQADLQAAIDPYNLRRLIPGVVAQIIDVGSAKFDALVALTATDLVTQAVIDGAVTSDHRPLATALAPMMRAVTALDDAVFTSDRIAFIAANREMFDLADAVAPFSRAAVLALAAYRAALADSNGASDLAQAVDAVLAAYQPGTGFAAADTANLAKATGGDSASIRVFAAGARLPANPVAALDSLRRIVTFAKDRGLGADSIALLASPDPEALGEAAESLKAALHLRLTDTASFEKAVDVHEDALRGLRRDALTDYMIRNSSGRFGNRGDLYNYYLIDPDMEGCARTSRVVSAIGSLQSYVHRIVLNLEVDRRAASAANHVHISPSRIPADEWEWRKNYRVWEANRKVFLWPENYMLPELRDNKTPLFEELEKTLLQQDINEQTVRDAYASYLRGFEEIASLRIAGAYHEHHWADGRDVLHLFGCTSDDPPTYYYWTVENLTFSKLRTDRRISYSARRRLNIAIPVRDVSPIIYNNRLHLFWLEISTNPWSRVRDGENQFRGYKHTLRPRFTSLKLDGTWSAPQSIELRGLNRQIQDQGIVYEGLRRIGFLSSKIPIFSDTFVVHEEPQDGHTLVTPAWQRIYPGLIDGELFLTVGGRHVTYRADMFERVAYAPTPAETSRLNARWNRSPTVMHIAGSSSTGTIHQQTVNGSLFPAPSPTVARQDFVTARWKFQSNLYGLSYPPPVETLYDAWDLQSRDLSTSLARVNHRKPHVVVPMSDWVAPSVLVQLETDVSCFGYSYDWSGRQYEARRLGTTVLGDLSRSLFYGGVNGLLDKTAQAGFAEKSHLITSLNYRTKVVGPTDQLDFTGPLGVYFRELFLHIPALIAAHQNSRGDYGAAQGWYQTIFDPTAEFDSGVNLSGLSESARLQAERDRVWQYAEFKGKQPPTLRAILSDDDAQEAYRKDPFNPYAIARLRLSAFQKNIVMRYCDNILDWADSLFRQFTRESVDEAHILYDLVRQILGPRPADAGDCGEGIVRPRTYAGIKPHMDKGQDFLIEVENWIIPRRRRWTDMIDQVTAKREFLGFEQVDMMAAEIRGKIESAAHPELRFDASRPPRPADMVETASYGATELMLGDDKVAARHPDAPTGKPVRQEVPQQVAQAQRFEAAVAKDGRLGRQLDWHLTGRVDAERANLRVLGAGGRNGRIWDSIRPDSFTWNIVRQIGPVFCVPRNKELLALWDRVEDRLFKIHNCRNIDGERIDLALFAPEIDPMALVRARAAGLSLSDILGASAGNLPPYRFNYLVAKARDYVGLVQGFGAKLQSAMERRDAEELAKLRLTQAINMQGLVTKIRENEVKIANESLAELQKRKEMFEYRESYLSQKIEEDLLPWDRAEQGLTHAAGVSKLLSSILNGTSGVLHLIPQLGSPFAMKYGGQELGMSSEKWAKVFKDTGEILMIAAKSASLEAKYAKQRKEWKHGQKLEDYELKQMEKRIKAAEIRVEIAEKALSNHQQAIKDQEELLDYYETKFTGEALYSWMAGTLQAIYRQAFNAAMSMARLAEHAYRFERPNDTAQLLDTQYWEPGHAGLLSGEKLAIDLIEMEKRYLETNYRTLEITQPFSLGQLDPAALFGLREAGECTFTIPEFAFDLLYPGQYRRRIRSARLSVACVTGPYVNIPVTLTLTGAKIRIEPTLDGAAGLTESVLRHTVQIATSTAQNDTGTFDFSFSDPRYMPFEGAGAVESQWRMSLPKTFRPFDYDTITDVVLHLSYTAESDGILRDRVEAENAALAGALSGVLADTGLPRAYSLRQELGTAFHNLKNGPLGVDTVVALDVRALPFPLRGRDLAIGRALLLLKPAAGYSATGTTIRVDGTTLSGFAASPEFPGFVVVDATAALASGITGNHTFAVTDAGGLGPGIAPAALIDGALDDIVIYVELTLD